MKCLWSIAVVNQALPVQIAAAKYFARSTLWHTRRTYGGTKLWKDMADAREALARYLKWSVGDHNTCQAFSQPRFVLWRASVPRTATQRTVTVRQFGKIEYRWMGPGSADSKLRILYCSEYNTRTDGSQMRLHRSLARRLRWSKRKTLPVPAISVRTRYAGT